MVSEGEDATAALIRCRSTVESFPPLKLKATPQALQKHNSPYVNSAWQILWMSHPKLIGMDLCHCKVTITSLCSCLYSSMVRCRQANAVRNFSCRLSSQRVCTVSTMSISSPKLNSALLFFGTGYGPVSPSTSWQQLQLLCWPQRSQAGATSWKDEASYLLFDDHRNDHLVNASSTRCAHRLQRQHHSQGARIASDYNSAASAEQSVNSTQPYHD